MNESFKQYAVFLDIDGTIMGSNPESLKKNIDTIQKVRSLGHKVFISTGRSNAFLPELLDIKRNFDGVSSGAGAVVTMGEKEILKKLMPYRVVESFCRFSVENEMNSIIEGELNLYLLSNNIKDRPGCITLEKTNYSNVITPDVPIEKFSIIGEIPKGLYKLLEDDCKFLQHEKYGEVLYKECGKGTALVKTAEYLGIPIERTVAMGDSLNDFDMIEAAGIGVAMGNAVDKIKEIADFTTTHVDEAGVAEALNRIFDLK